MTMTMTTRFGRWRRLALIAMTAAVLGTIIGVSAEANDRLAPPSIHISGFHFTTGDTRELQATWRSVTDAAEYQLVAWSNAGKRASATSKTTAAKLTLSDLAAGGSKVRAKIRVIMAGGGSRWSDTSAWLPIPVPAKPVLTIKNGLPFARWARVPEAVQYRLIWNFTLTSDMYVYELGTSVGTTRTKSRAQPSPDFACPPGARALAQLRIWTLFESGPFNSKRSAHNMVSSIGAERAITFTC